MSCIKKEKAVLVKELVRLTKLAEEAQRKLDHIGEVEVGDVPCAEQAARIKAQKFSFTVHFERRKSLRKVASPGAVCVSTRRFSSVKEANQHGKRFAKIHKHKDFVVVMVNKKANAWVNWATGKTNPAI